MTPPPGEITRLLAEFRQGRFESEAEFYPHIYAELRKIAGRCFGRERADHTLQPTELVHEAYVRLRMTTFPDVESRAHFFGIVARLMREILMDYARKRNSIKRGEGRDKLELREALGVVAPPEVGICDFERALCRLEERDERQARIVELRFFTGFSIAETADVLGFSKATVNAEWAIARAFLRREFEVCRESHIDS